MSARSPQNRSPRLNFLNVAAILPVRYFASGPDAPANIAQCADVSASGMQLVSRHPSLAQVGDFLDVEFTLPGADQPVRRSGRVVRRMNEYVFALRFTHPHGGESLDDLIAGAQRFLQTSKMIQPLRVFRNWLENHRAGILVSTIAISVALAAGTYIYLNSDEYRGTGIRSWGTAMPKEWFTDYYRKNN